MNYIFAGLFAISLLFAAFTGHVQALTDGVFEQAKQAVNLAIGLIGVMALWLGLLRIAEQAGLVKLLARLISPLTRRLFPDVPPDHPAMGAMALNIAANMLGLDNSATPLGLKAMEELKKLAPKKGVASDAMAMFLSINTASVTLIPASIIALRGAAHSKSPAEIVGPTLLATAASFTAAVITCKLLGRLPYFRRQLEEGEPEAKGSGGAPAAGTSPGGAP